MSAWLQNAHELADGFQKVTGLPNPFEQPTPTSGGSSGSRCNAEPSSEHPGVLGTVWVDGTALPRPSVLAPILQLAMQRVLVEAVRPSSGAANALQVYMHVADTESPATCGFRFYVSTAAVELVAARLRSEAACRGAECLLPELVSLLEERLPNLGHGHFRLRLVVDEVPDVQKPPPSRDADNAGVQRPHLSIEPQPLPLSQPAKSREEDATLDPGRAPSPTAQNLARDPGLRARVMLGAIPLDSDVGRRMSGAGRRSRSTSTCEGPAVRAL